MLSDLFVRVRSLFRRKAVEGELDDELREHFERQVEKHIASGLTPEEARRRTRLEFGGLDQIKEECRDARGVSFVETTLQDVRFAIRLLRKTPAITAVALLSLALGIGANTAIFSLIDSVMLRMLPVQKPQELVQVVFTSPPRANSVANTTPVATARSSFTNPLWEQIRDRQDVFSGVFAWSDTSFDLANGGQAENISGMYASGSYFATLGVRPALGRLIEPSDDVRGCPGAAVLGYGFWQRHYGGANDAVGRSIRLDGHSFPIIGVTQPGFLGTDVGERFNVAVPICAEATLTIGAEGSFLDNRSAWWLTIIGRLKPGMSSQQASARLAAVAPQIFGASVPSNWPPAGQESFRHSVLSARSAATGFSPRLRARYDQPLEIVMAVVGLVLLIACANIASLMLARASARRKEIAMRFSLGAARSRIVRQMLTESILLSGTGAALGVLFARWSEPLLVRLVSRREYPLVLDLSTDGRVLAFTAGIAILTGLLFGIWPALRASRVAPQDALRGGRSDAGSVGSRFRSGRWIVALQVALSLVLLIGTGLFVRTFTNLLSLDPGFDRSRVLEVSFRIHNAGIAPDARLPLYTEVLDRLKSLPGVVSASQVWFPAFAGAEWNEDITLEGYQPPPGQEPLVWFDWITPGYFSTLRTPLLSGRIFDSRDTKASPPVAIVNETFARRFFAKGNPLGGYFRVPGVDSPTAAKPIQIVGVVQDSKFESLREETLPFAYVPLTQMTSVPEESTFEIRTAVDPGSLIPAVGSAVGRINKSASLQFTTLDEQVDESLLQERLLATLSGFFGVLALLLTAIGLYGVMAYVVTQRTHEIGIRMALGARRASILRLVMQDVGVLLAAGIAAGLLGAWWVARFAEHLLFGVAANDARTMMLAAAALVAIALVASYLPARRAMRVDPMVALRYE
ncbi:MAG TPA: ABC transporter permease [Terriglobia bacterium]|nr:ABC transporter permease [Terriglobia bacterium]